MLVPLTPFLISATITPNKIIAGIVLLIVIVAVAFFWSRSRTS